MHKYDPLLILYDGSDLLLRGLQHKLVEELVLRLYDRTCKTDDASGTEMRLFLDSSK